MSFFDSASKWATFVGTALFLGGWSVPSSEVVKLIGAVLGGWRGGGGGGDIGTPESKWAALLRRVNVTDTVGGRSC